MLEGFPACRIAFDSMADAQEPGDMVYKYWQSSLLEKIATSNF